MEVDGEYSNCGGIGYNNVINVDVAGQDQNQWNCAAEKVLADHFPLHRACRDGDLDSVDRLLSGVDQIRTSGKYLAEDVFMAGHPFIGQHILERYVHTGSEYVLCVRLL